jgi:hypothetical protein
MAIRVCGKCGRTAATSAVSRAFRVVPVLGEAFEQEQLPIKESASGRLRAGRRTPELTRAARAAFDIIAAAKHESHAIAGSG